jgi:hypothetical protein
MEEFESQYMSPYKCFLDIIQQIQESTHSGQDTGKSVMTSPICYSKLRNFSGEYEYQGLLDVSSGTQLHYYFSNKRSYISMDKNETLCEVDDAKLQYFLLRYVQVLICDHKIDAFIHGLQNR